MEQLTISISLSYTKLNATEADVVNVFAWLSAKRTAAMALGAISASANATWYDKQGLIQGEIGVVLQKNPFTAADIANIRTWIVNNIESVLPTGCTSQTSYVWSVVPP